MVDYFERNGLLHPSHHGFRKGHNTTTALIEMIDKWSQAFDCGDISAVMALDMSAAFDLVDKQLFLQKLQAYKVGDGVLGWVDSYLSNRSQRVYIDGVLSDELPVTVGVPQGSILGPLFYIIFTSDLPQTIHSNHSAVIAEHSKTLCNDCGSLCCYADDSTFTISGSDPQLISEKLSAKYKEISHFMRNNRLILNSDKTWVLIMASEHRHKKHNDFGIQLNTGNEIIHPVQSEVLLDVTLSNNFQWNHHIRDGEQPLIRSLNRRNTALKRISRISDFKTRKMIGSGLIMSTISYAIQLYGGCSGYLIDALQVQQNVAMRHITKLPFLTSTKTLLQQCDWLSVRQMIMYFSLLLLHKALVRKRPEYINEKVRAVTVRRETRTTDRLKLETTLYKTLTASKSYIPRTIDQWNSLPIYLREIKDIVYFKKALREYIVNTIPVK